MNDAVNKNQKPKTFRELTAPKTKHKVYSNRPNACRRGYGYRWQKCRELFLKQHPLCAICLEQGKVVSSTVVDHIVPHKGDKKLFNDSANWQALCTSCHNTKTASEDGGFGNKINGA